MLVRSAIRLIKDWFSVMDEARQSRFPMRIRDTLKHCRLCSMDPGPIPPEHAAKTSDETFRANEGIRPLASSSNPFFRCPTDSLDGHGTNSENFTMAKTNYAFEKRQRDLQKKKKKEEKQKRKTENSSTPSEATDVEQAEGDLPETDTEQNAG